MTVKKPRTEYDKKYRLNNKKRIAQSNKQYQLKNRKKIIQYHKKYRLENQEKIKEWRLNNPEKIRENHKKYMKARRQIDEAFIMTSRLRTRLAHAFRQYSITGKVLTSKIYGIDFEGIIKHLGACPGNRADYHIDHIKPLSKFDFTDLEQIKQAFAPENHQWLTAEENMSKGNYDTYKYCCKN